MTFRSLLKIVRKGADFYLFILSANIERRRKQDSYCDYIHISQIYNAGRNINCLLYTSPSPRDLSTSRMPSSA